jgi:putative transposase
LSNVITIDDEGIKSHLDRVVRGSVEETLNALLDAEADRLCNAQRYKRSEARRIPGLTTTNVGCTPRLEKFG